MSKFKEAESKLYGFLLFLLFFVIISTIITIAKCTRDYSKKPVVDKTQSYNRVCIGGHQYWNMYNRLGIRLNDQGKPIKCEEK